MRRRRDLIRAEHAKGEASDLTIEDRYRRLGRLMMAAEPGSEGAELAAQIAAKRQRLDAKGDPIEKRLEQLERFICGLGLGERAEHFIHQRYGTGRPPTGRPAGRAKRSHTR